VGLISGLPLDYTPTDPAIVFGSEEVDAKNGRFLIVFPLFNFACHGVRAIKPPHRDRHARPASLSKLVDIDDSEMTVKQSHAFSWHDFLPLIGPDRRHDER
jgi:hypothetical protein